MTKLLDATNPNFSDPVDENGFDAFGNGGANEYSRMGYAGEYHDAETGFIYLRARYYNPAIGRFINEDPIRDGLNWYAYCHNDPVNFVDPSGLVVTDWDKAHCTKAELKQLEKNTEKWENGTPAEKVAAAASSREIREKYRTASDILHDDGTVSRIFKELCTWVTN